MPGVHGQTCCNVVLPVSAVSKNKREIEAVVGITVAKLHLQLCPIHQRPVKTASGTGCASSDVVANFCYTSIKAFSWISFSEICSFFVFLSRNTSNRGDRKSAQCGMKRL